MHRITLPRQTLIGEDVAIEAEWLELHELETLDDNFIRYWRGSIREKLHWLYGEVRPRICLVCGDTFGGFDLHHAIVTRGDVQGWFKLRRLLIDTELNLIPLHPECHRLYPPTREEAWAYQVAFYTEWVMKRWYTALPWKGKPRIFWEDHRPLVRCRRCQ